MSAAGRSSIGWSRRGDQQQKVDVSPIGPADRFLPDRLRTQLRDLQIPTRRHVPIDEATAVRRFAADVAGGARLNR